MVPYRFTVTEEALQTINSTLSKRRLPKILRIGIKERGYYIECAEYVSANGDTKFDCGNDVTIVIDNKNIRFINGSILRWVKTSKEQGLKISNPNDKAIRRSGSSLTV